MFKQTEVLDPTMLTYEDMKRTFTLGKFQDSNLGTPQFHHNIVCLDNKKTVKFDVPYAMTCSPLNRKVDTSGKVSFSFHASLYPNKRKDDASGHNDLPYLITREGEGMRNFLENFDKLYASLMDEPENEDTKRQALKQLGLIGPALNAAMKESFAKVISSRVEMQYDETGMTETKSPTFSVKLWTGAMRDEHENKRGEKLVLKNETGNGKKDEIVWTDIYKYVENRNGGWSLDAVKNEKSLEQYTYEKDDSKNGTRNYFDVENLITITVPTYYGSKQSGKVTPIYKLHKLVLGAIIPREFKRGITKEESLSIHERFAKKRKLEGPIPQYDAPFSQPHEFDDDYDQSGGAGEGGNVQPVSKKIKVREMSIPFRSGNERASTAQKETPSISSCSSAASSCSDDDDEHNQ